MKFVVTPARSNGRMEVVKVKSVGKKIVGHRVTFASNNSIRPRLTDRRVLDPVNCIVVDRKWCLSFSKMKKGVTK